MRIPRWVVVPWSVFVFVVFLIGLGGIPDNVAGWAHFLRWIAPHINHEATRWVLFLVGLGSLYPIAVWRIVTWGAPVAIEPRDEELRRLLGLFMDELYRDASRPAGRLPDYREAIEYADKALAEMKRSKREAPLTALRQALREFSNDAGALMGVFERNEHSDEAGLTLMRCQRKVAAARTTVESFLYRDIPATRQSLTAVAFAPENLSGEELELLGEAATAGPLSAFDADSGALQVRSDKRTFGPEFNPLHLGSSLVARPPMPWLDAFNSLRTKGLIVGPGDAAPRTITARGMAVLLCLVQQAS
ncbi:MAG: hypothetical protein E6G00_14115 [Actinobacteria bacterium]|nr:MAG: hypothetical protein E6G00_14115 [Actinomycetota bacterium]